MVLQIGDKVCVKAHKLADFRRRLVDAEKARSEGWANAATFLAHTYITQSRAACTAVERIRRRDGRINPDKLRDLFEALTSREVIPPVDDWALEPALDIPEEFAHLRDTVKPAIKWSEICDFMLRTYREGLCG